MFIYLFSRISIFKLNAQWCLYMSGFFIFLKLILLTIVSSGSDICYLKTILYNILIWPRNKLRRKEPGFSWDQQVQYQPRSPESLPEAPHDCWHITGGTSKINLHLNSEFETDSGMKPGSWGRLFKVLDRRCDFSYRDLLTNESVEFSESEPLMGCFSTRGLTLLSSLNLWPSPPHLVPIPASECCCGALCCQLCPWAAMPSKVSRRWEAL